MSAESHHLAERYRRSARALCLIVALRGVDREDALVTEALYQCAIAETIATAGVWS